MKNDYVRGVSLALTAAVCWGTMSPAAKVLTAGGISQMTAIIGRALLVSVVLGPWLIIKRRDEIRALQAPTYRYYILSGILSVVCSGAGFLMSLETLTVPQALIIHYTFPMVTLAGSLWVTHEKPSKREVLAGFLILFGVYMGMASGTGSTAGLSVTGVMWGILAVIGISGQSLLVRRFSKGQSSDQLMLLFFVHFFGLFFLLVIKSLLTGWSDIQNFTLPLALVLTMQAFLGGLVAYGLFYTALKYIPAATVSLLCTLEMVVAVVLTAILVGLPPTLRESVGCLVILAAVILASYRKKA